jgi:epoxyqueuosine reductase QueG
MDYLPATTPEGWQAIEFERLERPQEAIVSLYARGRDYHKVLRNRLQKLAERIAKRSAPSATACSPTRRRCWRWNWARAAARAGAASTRWC